LCGPAAGAAKDARREWTAWVADEKLTYAATDARQYIVDYSLATLEQALGARDFLRNSPIYSGEFGLCR